MEPLLCYSTSGKTLCPPAAPAAPKTLSTWSVILYLLLMLLPLLLSLSGQAQSPKSKSTLYAGLAQAENHSSTVQPLPAVADNIR